MSADDPTPESAVAAAQHVHARSMGDGLETGDATDLDALLSGHSLDPHFTRQLQELDSLDLGRLEDNSHREATPSTPSSESSVARNPLAPADHPSSTRSGSTTPTQPLHRQSSIIGASKLDTSRSASPRHPLVDEPLENSSLSASASPHLELERTDSPMTEPATSQVSRQASLAPTEDETDRNNERPDGPEAAAALVAGGEREAKDNHDMPPAESMDEDSANRVSAYARLDFDSFTFYVQTLQVVLGRRSEMGGTNSDVDVHLGPAKAISRRHAKIFYNFATQRFELTVIGRNGAFVGDVFVETGSTVPLRDSTKVQIGQIAFNFVLPLQGEADNEEEDVSDHVVEELELADEPAAKKAASKSKEKVGAGLGSEKGRGGKLKQRAEAKTKVPDGTPAIEEPRATDSHTESLVQSHSALAPVPSGAVKADTAAKSSAEPNPLSGAARKKPRQLSFLKRADENNFFAHMPPDQLAAVNAQVDAAIAGLPEIPGFDTPATGTDGPSVNHLGNAQRGGSADPNLNQLLSLQAQLGLQGSTNNTALLEAAGNLSGSSSFPQGDLDSGSSVNAAASIEQLRGLQGLDGLQGLSLQALQGLQNFQGVQPAAGLGLLQQLQALQQNKSAALQPPTTQTRPKRKQKKEWRPEDIPEEYRTKPPHSYSFLITAALRDRLSSMPDGTQGGLSLGDIYEAIMELYPYYRYCQPGWQNSVRHNLSSSKSFRKVSKEGKGWLWGLDEKYLAEKEKQRQRAQQRQQQQMLAQQQAMAEQRAREQEREQARVIQMQRDRERELEQRRFLAERAARAAQVGVPLHQLSATLGTNHLQGLGDVSASPAAGFGNPNGSSIRSAGMATPSSEQPHKPAVLPPETIKLLAGLQQHVQQELAKDNQPPLNPQLLSNALAVVIAQTAKQAGGLQNLGTVLQQPGSVQKLLNQAMQLLRSTQRVPAPPQKPAAAAPPQFGSGAVKLPATFSAPANAAAGAHSSRPSLGQNVALNSAPHLATHTAASSLAGAVAEPSVHSSASSSRTPSASSLGQGASAPSPSTSAAGAMASAAAATSNASSTPSAAPSLSPGAPSQAPSLMSPAADGAAPLSAPRQAGLTGTASDPRPAGSAAPNTAVESAALPNQPRAGGSAGDPTSNTGQPQSTPIASPGTSGISQASTGGAALGQSRETAVKEHQTPGDHTHGAQTSQGSETKQEGPAATTGDTDVPKTTLAKRVEKKPGSQPKKPQPSLEKISEILSKAEAIPNPTDEVRGMIEKLKAHKRQLELKRQAEHKEAAEPPAKRQTVG